MSAELEAETQDMLEAGTSADPRCPNLARASLPAQERAYSDCSSHRKQLGHQAQPRSRYDEQGWGTVNTHRQKQSKSSSAMREHVSHSTADLIIGCLRRCVYTMTVPTGPRYEYSGVSSSWIGGTKLMAQRPLKPCATVDRVKRLCLELSSSILHELGP